MNSNFVIKTASNLQARKKLKNMIYNTLKFTQKYLKNKF